MRLQLASQEPVLVGEVVADQHFFARLAGPLHSKCILAVAHSFTELSRNCRQKTLSADRSHQQGRIRRKAKTRDDGGWLWQSLAFGSLAAALGFCFSTSETDTSVNPKSKFSKLFKEQWHDHIRAKNYIVLHCTMHLQCTMVIQNIQLARNFREKNLSRGELNFRED